MPDAIYENVMDVSQPSHPKWKTDDAIDQLHITHSNVSGYCYAASPTNSSGIHMYSTSPLHTDTCEDIIYSNTL